MSITHVVTPSDLGTTIKAGGIIAGKYDVNIDDTTLKQTAGVLRVNTDTTALGKSALLESMVKAFETTTSLTYSSTTKVLSYTNEDGVVVDIDLSALAVDIFVNGATYNASTMTLTLTDNSGTSPDITIDLSELKRVVTANSNSITFTGTGEAGTALTANIKIDPAVTNLLTVTAAGVALHKAAVTGLATVELWNAFDTVRLGYIFP